jgi:hypothetical protein
MYIARWKIHADRVYAIGDTVPASLAEAILASGSDAVEQVDGAESEVGDTGGQSDNQGQDGAGEASTEGGDPSDPAVEDGSGTPSPMARARRK